MSPDVVVSADPVPDPVPDLDAATCSNGAPSARNLIVTVFGDLVLPAGAATELTVQALAALLAGFGVNERLVRTSLSRIVADGLLAVRSEGRRSFYRVDPDALELFRTADRRIYVGTRRHWDGAWTIVVLDGSEASPQRRARLRQQLTWAGLGVVAPNVLASPVVTVGEVSELVARVGGFEHVLVSRADVVDGVGLLGAEALARRCAVLDDVEQRYAAFARRFERFDGAVLESLDDVRAFKVRTLLVSTFRRIALADPQLPPELLPTDWVGDRARMSCRRVYRAVAVGADRFARDVAGLRIATDPDRFA